MACNMPVEGRHSKLLMAKPPVSVVSDAAVETPTPNVSIVLDDSNSEKFKDCQVGDEKWVLVRVDEKTDMAIEGTVLDVEYDEEAEEEPSPMKGGMGMKGDMPKAIKMVAKGGY